MEGPKTNTATTADFCDSGGAAEMAIQAMFLPMQGWANALKVCLMQSQVPCLVALLLVWHHLYEIGVCSYSTTCRGVNDCCMSHMGVVHFL